MSTLLVFILFVPVDIEFTYNNQAHKKAHTKVIWLFGLVRFNVGVADKSKFKVNATELEQHKAKKREKKSGSLKSVLVVMKSKGFIKRVIRLMREAITVAEIERFHWHLSFGLDDPADTGRVYGLLSPAFAFMYTCPRIHFSFFPLFDRIALETKICCDFRIVPMKFIWVILRFIFSVESLRAINATIKAG